MRHAPRSSVSDVASGKDDQRQGFLAALAACRRLGATLVAASLDRIIRRAHTMSQLLEDRCRYGRRTAPYATPTKR